MIFQEKDRERARFCVFGHGFTQGYVPAQVTTTSLRVGVQ